MNNKIRTFLRHYTSFLGFTFLYFMLFLTLGVDKPEDITYFGNFQLVAGLVFVLLFHYKEIKNS